MKFLLFTFSTAEAPFRVKATLACEERTDVATRGSLATPFCTGHPHNRCVYCAAAQTTLQNVEKRLRIVAWPIRHKRNEHSTASGLFAPISMLPTPGSSPRKRRTSKVF